MDEREKRREGEGDCSHVDFWIRLIKKDESGPFSSGPTSKELRAT